MHVSLGTKSPAVVLGCLVKGIVGEFQELDIMLFFCPHACWYKCSEVRGRRFVFEVEFFMF